MCGGSVYSEEEEPESFVKEEKLKKIPVKLGQLNNGFTFFDDHNYSTRLIIKERKVQAIELFVKRNETIPLIELEVPTIPDDKLSHIGNIECIVENFQIPDKLKDNKDDIVSSQNK